MTADTNRAAVERSLRWRLFAAIFVGVLILLVSILAFVGKAITQRTFLIIVLIYAVLMFAATTAVFVSARKRLQPFAADLLKFPDAAEQKRLRHRIGILAVFELLLALALILGLLQLREPQPWPPHNRRRDHQHVLPGDGNRIYIPPQAETEPR